MLYEYRARLKTILRDNKTRTSYPGYTPYSAKHVKLLKVAIADLARELAGEPAPTAAPSVTPSAKPARSLAEVDPTTDVFAATGFAVPRESGGNISNCSLEWDQSADTCQMCEGQCPNAKLYAHGNRPQWPVPETHPRTGLIILRLQGKVQDCALQEGRTMADCKVCGGQCPDAKVTI